MMTSYFGKNVRNGVSIAQSHPKGWSGPEVKLLAPTWDMIRLAKRGQQKEYIEEYQIILDKLDPHKVYDVLGNATLLCWERPGEFCHRRLVADWITDNVGIAVPEI